MFVELAPIVKTTMIQLLISAEGDLMRVIVAPKAVEGQNPALSSPLSLLATPAEFDEKLAGILSNYAENRQSLEDSLENVRLVMDAAKKDAQGKAKAKPAGGTHTGKVSVDEDDLSEDEPYEQVASSGTSPKPLSPSDDVDLFG